MMSNRSSTAPYLAADMNPAAGAGQPFVSKLSQSLQHFYAAVIRGQEARARRLASPYLARHDDAALARLGFGPAEIARIRRDGAINPRFGC